MILIFLKLVLSAHLSHAQEAGISAVVENRKGIEALKKENPNEAQKHFIEALSGNPLDARIQFNLGYSLEKMDQLEKARSAYDTAAKLGSDSEVLFMAQFNRGVLYQKEKKIPEALAAYQEALKYNPESKETKTNIELLTQDQQGKGKGDSKEKKDDKKDGEKGQDSKDQKDKGDPKDDKDKNSDGEQKEKEKPKQYGKNKPQPKPFKSEDLTQGDVNKILGEIKQQEQKIRAEFNKKDNKDQGKEKDW